jgi:CBS domain-containing protein
MTVIATQSRLTLHAETAGDLMMSNPVSIRENASVHEAIVLFTRKGFSAAPVIDDAGRPVGVVSCSDVIIHDRTNAEWGSRASERFKFEDEANGQPRSMAQAGVQETTRISELMTPAVFCVSPDTAAAKVIQEMLALKVHRLFVVDADGVLVGVISALDVLRHLHD